VPRPLSNDIHRCVRRDFSIASTTHLSWNMAWLRGQCPQLDTARRTRYSLHSQNTPTCYPARRLISAHLPSGRPTMHYLKLPWSHGQQDLVRHGFPDGMSFTDAALARGDGVLIQSVSFFFSCFCCVLTMSSCQCGISRSATMVIAVVMRAAAHSLPCVPPDIHACKAPTHM
jgi:tyrosine-protein phosphatase